MQTSILNSCLARFFCFITTCFCSYNLQRRATGRGLWKGSKLVCSPIRRASPHNGALQRPPPKLYKTALYHTTQTLSGILPQKKSCPKKRTQAVVGTWVSYQRKWQKLSETERPKGLALKEIEGAFLHSAQL